MTTLQKVANAYVDEGGFVYPWSRPDWLLADDGTSRLAYTTLYYPYGWTPSSWVRLGFDFASLPAGSVVSGATIDLLDASGSSPFGDTTTQIEAQYWDGTKWVDAGIKPLTVSAADYSLPSFTVSRDVLLGWSNGYGVRVRTAMVAGLYTTHVYVGAVAVTVTYEAPAVPTVTAVSPAGGAATGGTRVTITGTGFQFNDQDVVSSVTIGGVACTEIDVQSDTSLTCVTGAHALGAVDVVVTNAGGSGTLSNGFTYISVSDNVVKVVKGGVVSGSSMASADLWPAEPTDRVYGGPTELWDALTVADVNASDFGFVISATVGTGALARVDYAAARFYYQVPGLSDPASYLAVLRVAGDRQAHRPDVWKLPRNGFAVANDPQIDRRITSGAEFRFSRQYGPGRLVEKVLHSRELWLEESVSGNTPGLQVWARTDEGVEFQLEDASGDPATLRGTGAKEVFFPKGDLARCKYWQLIYRVPELAAGQVAAAYTFRDGITHFLARPKISRVWDTTLVLSGGEFEDKTTQRATPAEQLRRLEALRAPGRPAVPYRDPQGRTGYLHVIRLQTREVVFKEGPKANVLVANVRLRLARYE